MSTMHFMAPGQTSTGESKIPASAEELTRRNIESISRLEHEMLKKRTLGDRVADVIAGFCGSMSFVWAHILWFGGWIFFNTMAHVKHPDPFPFQFLTLIVSLEAIFLTTFVMISQNRQARVSDRRNHLDLQINLLAEQENSKMLAMLEAIERKLHIAEEDPEVHLLEQETQTEKLVQQIDRIMENAAETIESQRTDVASVIGPLAK